MAKAHGEASFSVHVASFRELSRAEELCKELIQNGLGPAFIVSAQLPTSGRWQHVMVGRYRDAEAAARAAKGYLASGTFHYAKPRRLPEYHGDEPKEVFREETLRSPNFSRRGAGDE